MLNILLGIFNFVQVSFYTKINYIFCIKHFKFLFKMIDKSILSYISVLICAYLYGQIPSLYISFFVSKENAALYFAAFTISMIVNMLTVAQIQKTIADLINVSIPIVKKVLCFNLKVIMFINLSILIFFVLFGKCLLKFIYSQTYYLKAYPLLLILTFANIFIALAAIYGAYITASGNQHMKIKMQIEAIIISIISLVVFHNFGIYAAALSYLLSAIHIGIRYIITTKKLLKNKTNKNL